MQKTIIVLLATLVVAFTNPNPASAATETDCTDGVNNDNDTDIDCADTDCYNKPGPAGTTCPAAGPPLQGAQPASTGNPPAAPPASSAPCTPECDKKLVALAARWNLKLSEPTATPACELTCTTDDGKVCWSPAFEAGKAWDWTEAPMRWSRSADMYVSRAVFMALDRSSQVVDIGEKLAKLETDVEDLQKNPKADKSVVDDLQKDLKPMQDDYATLLASGSVENPMSLAQLKRDVDGMADDVAEYSKELKGLKERTTTVEGKVTVLEEHAREIDEIVEYVLAGPEIFHGFSAGIAGSAGVAPDAGEDSEGNPLYYRTPGALMGVGSLDLGFCDRRTAHCLTTSVGGGVGYDTGLGIAAFGSVGPEFKVSDVASVGVHGGLQASGNGVHNGAGISGAVEGTIAFRLRLRPPVEAAGTFSFLLDVGGAFGSVYYEQGMEDAGSARVFGRLTLGSATRNATAPEYKGFTARDSERVAKDASDDD